MSKQTFNSKIIENLKRGLLFFNKKSLIVDGLSSTLDQTLRLKN